MKLDNINTAELLPEFMRGDDFNRSLAQAVDNFIKRAAATLVTFSTWDRIDELTENEMDNLAMEMNIGWYRQTASMETKQQIIKNYGSTLLKCGTKWAAEEVVCTYFGSGYIREWYEYEGEPGHFKVFTTNHIITDNVMREFVEVLEKVKRASSHLDEIIMLVNIHVEAVAGSKQTYATYAPLSCGTFACGTKPRSSTAGKVIAYQAEALASSCYALEETITSGQVASGTYPGKAAGSASFAAGTEAENTYVSATVALSHCGNKVCGQ